MASTQAPAASGARRSGAAQRVGYIIGIVMNAVLLGIAPRLLDWAWPAFLTDRFEDLLPLVSASFIAGIIANACFLVHDRGRFRAFVDLVTAGVALAVVARTWALFPFDFGAYSHDWSWLFRTGLAAAIVGIVIAMIVNTVKLLNPTV